MGQRLILCNNSPFDKKNARVCAIIWLKKEICAREGLRLKREKQAKRFYEELESLSDINTDISKKLLHKAKQIGKDQFIKDYPLSALEVVNYRTFWEICLDLGIVNKPFNSEYEDFSTFERKLYDIILSSMYLEDASQFSKEEIIRLFKKHKYCS